MSSVHVSTTRAGILRAAVAVIATAALATSVGVAAAYGYARLDSFIVARQFERLERLRAAVTTGETGADQVEWLRLHWQHSFAVQRIGDRGADASSAGVVVGVVVAAIILHVVCAVLVVWPIGRSLRAASLPSPRGLTASVVRRAMLTGWWRFIVCGAAAGLAYGAAAHLTATVEDAWAAWPWAAACAVFIAADGATLLRLTPRSLAALAPAPACAACGYAGVEPGAVCPECGRTEPSSSPWVFPWPYLRLTPVRAALFTPHATLFTGVALLLLSVPGAPALPGALGDRLRLSPGAPADNWSDARVPPSVRTRSSEADSRRALLVIGDGFRIGVENGEPVEGGPPVVCRLWQAGSATGPLPGSPPLAWVRQGPATWRFTVPSTDGGGATITIDFIGGDDPFVRCSRPISSAVVVEVPR